MTESVVARFTQMIKAALEHSDLSPHSITQRANLPPDAFYRALRHEPSLSRADSLCRALDVTFCLGQDNHIDFDENLLDWTCKRVIEHLQEEKLYKHAKPADIAGLIVYNYRVAARHAAELAAADQILLEDKNEAR